MKIENNNINIFMTAKAKEKMEVFVDLAPGEISGFGSVKILENGFLIEDIYLPKQVNTGSTTEIEAEDVGKLLYELDKQGIDVNTIKLWWHSHATMGVFWSSTDVDTQKILNPKDYFISIVTNKAKATLAKVVLTAGVNVVFNEVPIQVVHIPDEALIKECKEQFEANAEEKKYGGVPYYTKHDLRTYSMGGCYDEYGGYTDIWGKDEPHDYYPAYGDSKSESTIKSGNEDNNNKSDSVYWLNKGKKERGYSYDSASKEWRYKDPVSGAIVRVDNFNKIPEEVTGFPRYKGNNFQLPKKEEKESPVVVSNSKTFTRTSGKKSMSGVDHISNLFINCYTEEPVVSKADWWALFGAGEITLNQLTECMGADKAQEGVQINV